MNLELIGQGNDQKLLNIESEEHVGAEPESALFGDHLCLANFASLHS